MTKEEYLDQVKVTKINEERVSEISTMYNNKIEGLVAKIISYADSVDFFDEERRALSYLEIKNAKKILDYDCIRDGVIPVIDSYDNTYIVYILYENMWAKYSLSDKILYKKRDALEKVL